MRDSSEEEESTGEAEMEGISEEEESSNKGRNKRVALEKIEVGKEKRRKIGGEEISAKYLAMECSEARRSTGETKNLLTNESSQPNKRTRSDHGQKFDVFLSHSGEQKNFARQLGRDLTNQGFFCFFDEDHESLPVGEDFPSRIFKAAETCSLAVLLLSEEFLQKRWPMLELSTFVKARNTNRHLEIIPLFYTVPPEALQKFTADDEKWKDIEKSEEKRAEWHQALKAIRKIKGLKFGGNEVEFRDNIVREIWRKIPTASPRYHVPCMQGELRMCQEVADFFNKEVQPNKKGISIAGLYGIAGQGKTTLGKSFCNLKLKDFEGKVCHLEFSRGDSFERTKLALQYLIHYSPWRLGNLTKDQAEVKFHERVKGQRVLLVLDNITEDSIDEVRYFMKTDLGENSCILLSTRSSDVLVKHCNINPQSCMRVPSLEEDDAIAILLESTSLGESKLVDKDKAFALKCANRCSFKEISCNNGRRFHPLALKAFGSHLCGKYGPNLSKWVAVIDDLVDRPGYGLDGVFNLLDKAFNDMDPKYHTIFMLLTVYRLPNMSPHNVTEWLAINCNEDIPFIEIAVEDLCKKAFIEEFVPEIRIHDLYIEFAQSKAKKMGRWLWYDERSMRGLIPQDDAGFELAKFERCMYAGPFQISGEDLRNLMVLQLVDMQNMSNLDLGPMQRLRSITLDDCKVLAALDGMENLLHLAWLQIRGVDRMLKLPNLSRLIGLQHLEIDIAISQVFDQLGDLTRCFYLREINVRCPSLLEFPRLKGLPHLEKVEFSMCDKVKAPLDCRECVELQSIVLVSCCQMAESPFFAECKKLSKIVLSECDAVTSFPDINVPSALKALELQISPETTSAPIILESCYRLENLQLWDMRELKELPSFRSLSNLTVLKIGKCGIREPPDLTCCVMLEDVYFFTLKNLIRFPTFSLLRRLKKLSLCNCSLVRNPPVISGCHQLQLFHLLYNDNMTGLSKMDKCTQLEEIKVSWHCMDEVTYEGIDPDSFQVDDELESCLDCFKDVILENLNGVSVPRELEQWLESKTMLAKKYFRGLRLYYSVTAPYESDKSSKHYNENSIVLRLVNSKVLAFPTSDRVNEHDGVWLNRVREYFAGQDTARANTASGPTRCCSMFQNLFSPKIFIRRVNDNDIQDLDNDPFQHRIPHVDTSSSITRSPRYRVKMWKTKVCQTRSGFYFRTKFSLPFGGGYASSRQKLALQYLTQFRNLQLEWLTSKDKALYLSNKTEGERVWLVLLDNITENNIDEVRYYLGEEGRCILSSVENSNINSRSLIRHEEKGAIVIFIERLFMLTDFLSNWFAKIDGLTDGPHYQSRWIAQKDGLGDHMVEVFDVLDTAFNNFDRMPRFYIYHLEKWFAEINCVDDVFAGLCWLAIWWGKEISSSKEVAGEVSSSTDDDVERRLSIKCEKEIKYIKEIMSSDRIVKWIAINCRKEIMEKVEEMKHKVIIEGDFIKELFQIIKENYNESVRKIEEAISPLLQYSPWWHVPSMEGETRMCQKVADFFNNVHFNKNKIRIAGLYGMPGLGKTTLGKAFCNFNFGNFVGRVCHLEFCGGNALDRQKFALQYLAQLPTSQYESVTLKDNLAYYFSTFVKGHKVLLVLDNVTEDSIDEVRNYLVAEWGENSHILLIARSVDVLKKLNIDSQSCMRVPRLEEEEAIYIFLERMCVKKSALGAEHRGYALKCANICSFKEDRDSAPTFHPLALKAFGGYLFSKHRSDLSKWVAEIDGFTNGASDGLDGIFAVLDKAFDDMDRRYRTIFMVLTSHLPYNMPSNILKWVALNCNEEITYIEKVVADLCENAFIEQIEPEIRIHDLIKEFVQRRKNNCDEAGQAKFRDEIVRAISRLLPQKYDIPAMQGEARMCQKLADSFNTVHPNAKGIRIAGLYGMPGVGKTIFGKAFCNFNLGKFDGRVYHLEFVSGGHSMDRENFKLLTKILRGQRVLLVLDNIQTEESIDVVKSFLRADLGKNSWILLSARSVDVLKNFNDVQSCMSVPGLEEKEAIAILLEGTSLAESALEAENRGFALQCANRCSFKETSSHIVMGAHRFHPLALRSFGRHLFSKYGSDLSNWVVELDGLAVGSGDCLDDMFAVLDKTFDDMDPKYHTIFMLLTVYMPPNMLPHKVTEWLAVTCKEDIGFIEKAVEDLRQKAFIEEIKPEILIHELYMEFAESKARKMGRWLWCKGDLITSEANGGLFSEDGRFELAKLEYWQHQDLSQIGDEYVKNLWALQLVVAPKEMSNLELSSMKNIRSLTLHDCKYLEVLQGMENLPCLAWLQIGKVPRLKVLNLSSLTALQYLEINTGGPTELGDLTGCVSLRAIHVRCPSLSEFPRINGLPYLEIAKFKACEEVIGPLDCRACVKLQNIALENCWQMAHIPLIDGCSNLSKIVLTRCDQVTECSDKYALQIVNLCISSEDTSAPRHSGCCDGLKNIPLWNIIISTDVPSLRRFSNLTVLKLYKCDIVEPPDVACCTMLEDVCFTTLINLESFPNFSSLWKLKKLCLCNCKRVRAPPDIGGCSELQVFHLLYNDNMKGLPKMDGCQALEEIKLSWHSEEVLYYSHSYEYDDLEFCPDYQKDEIFRKINDKCIPEELKEWQWIQGKTVRLQQYFCGEKVYYSITAPYESYSGNGTQTQASYTDPLEQVIIQRASDISDEDEIRFREKVMRAIGRLIPQRIRFPYSSMQKETTSIWLEKASPIKGIHVAGLYETAGNEKTILCQSFYNFILNGFEGEVTPLEFSRGNSMERLNKALQYLTCRAGLETTPPTSEILDEDAFSKGPTFNIMILLIRYPISDIFIDNNLMEIAIDFQRIWGGNTLIVFRSQRYTIIELSRP